MSREEKGRIKPKRDRYWSVMLVGDHGRVIPFRHFKGLAIGICIGFILSLIALAVLAVLYTHQGQKLERLNAQFKEAKHQITQLKDEKDLYLTKLMVKKNRNREVAQKPKSSETASKKDETKTATPTAQIKPEAKTAPAEPIQEAPPPKQPPEVQWDAEIERISVDYDPRAEMLNTQFRIYNRSEPKKPISGRSVVVLKVSDDPPLKWLPVPRVQLRDGKPSGKHGQAFKIRNFRTMQFRAYRQKAPIRYDAADIYVFSSEGRLIANKEYAFKIDYKPPQKTVKPQPSPSSIQPEKTETSTAGPATVQTPDTPPGSPVSPQTVEQPSGAPTAPEEGDGTVKEETPVSKEATPPSETDSPQVEGIPGSPAPATDQASPATTETPQTTQPAETVPKPNTEGEQQ